MTKFAIVRHGWTRYWHGDAPVHWEEANDLAMPIDQIIDVELAIKHAELEVSNYADLLISKLDKRPIIIYTSPAARAGHTARLYVERLKHLRMQVLDVVTAQALREVDNMIDMYWSLVDGGLITYDCYEIEIDRSITNPKNLSHGHYYLHESHKQISPSFFDQWPATMRDAILAVEPSSSVTNRTVRYISEEAKKNPEHQLIFVTHYGSTIPFVWEFSKNEHIGLKQSQYLLGRSTSDGGLFVTETKDLDSGNHLANIATAYL